MTDEEIFSLDFMSDESSLMADLSYLYKNHEKRVSNKRIPLVLTAVLCIVITGVWVSDTAIKYGGRDVIWWFYTMAEQLSLFWCLPLLGFAGLDPDTARDRIDIIIEYVRVSSQEQSSNSGKQRQKDTLDEEIMKIDCEEVIPVADDWESASTMLRENIDEIVETVRDYPDETIALMIENVDRLSRAPPFEAAVFLWVLSRYDVIVYFGDLGYFDFTDPNQQMMAFFALYRSRQDFNDIKERTSSGQKQIKEEDGAPFRTPFGYSKIDTKTHKLEINEKQAEVIKEAVNRIITAVDPVVSSIYEDLQDKYESKVEDFPSYGNLFNILRSRKYTGEITHDGEVIGDIPQIVSKEDYESVVETIGMPNNGENDDLDHALQSIIDRFGIDGSINLFDVIKGRCPECGGDVKTMGSTERWGNRVLKYRCIGANLDSDETAEEDCKNTEEDDDAEADNDDSEETEQGCGFTGPLLSRSFLQNWERGLPIVCPRCQSPADEDDWKRSDAKINAVEQTCDECGLWYSADVGIEYDSAVERGMNIPKHAIRWFDDDTDTDADSDSEANQQKPDDAKSTDKDSNQQKFDNFR